LKQIQPFFLLIRYQNLMLLALNLILVYWCQIVNHSAQPNSIHFTIIALAILLISAAGYIINDIFDVEIDLLNKPSSVIIDNKISKKKGFIFYLLFNIIALIVGFYLNLLLGAIFFTVIALLWWYSFYFKQTILVGNLLIAIFSAAPILVLSYYYRHYNQTIYFYSFFAFAITLLREMVKDIEDMEGDKANNCKTLPIIFGVASIQWLIQIIASSISFSILMALYFSAFSSLKYILSFVLLAIIYFQIKLFSAQSKSDFSYLSIFLKSIMLIGVLSIIFA
jgi:4-hydroxybenzoate polyprenyltransferase